MDLTGGLAGEVAKLPAEFQPVLNALMDHIAQLEAQTAKDVDAIADKVIAGLTPSVNQAVAAVNTLTVTASAAVTEIVNTARRINGAKITVDLGPDGQ